MNDVLIEQREAIKKLLSQFGSFQIRVSGDSMFPTFSENDLVNIKDITNNRQVEVGDIILFQRYSILILHRIIKKQGNFCYVKGDNEDEIDIVRDKNIIGKVCGEIKEIRINEKVKVKIKIYTFVFNIVNNILESIIVLRE